MIKNVIKVGEKDAQAIQHLRKQNLFEHFQVKSTSRTEDLIELVISTIADFLS